MRKALAVLAILLCSATPSLAQVSLGFNSPGVSIGVNLPVYPDLVRIPGYPVYYAPQVNANYFFYDGLYWVFDGVNWYASTWYNGPWQLVTSDAVPLFLWRVPVRYYRERPAYFRGWALNAPPRWGAHWGNTWAQRHRGWDRWNRASVPAAAPLPTYQRRYAGNRYPRGDEQRALETRNYRYQPRERVAQQHFQQRSTQSTPAARPQGRTGFAENGRERGRERNGIDRTQNANRNVQRVAPPATAQRGGPPVTAQRAAPRERGAPPTARRAGPPDVENGAPRAAPPRGEARAAQGRGPQAREPAQAANRRGNSGAAHARGDERRDEHNG
ncbi:MAG TPA: hypothetical protein VFO53_04115 [Casimicrobiaceae bacterium]|nr:hypothetical protein [Casimicrobiaceae bacterium]